MTRLTTDDLLREAAETRLVRRNELLPLLVEALKHDEAARRQLGQLLESVAKPAEQPRQISPGYAWLPTFEWERDGESVSLKITDVARVPFRLSAVDEDGKSYAAYFGEHGVFLVPDGALDPGSDATTGVGSDPRS